uniref:Uncharacterized protein n=1 Tax=Arundo donax TaxID=35708 RepID=A0A0A9CA14_ARUDO
MYNVVWCICCICKALFLSHKSRCS